MAERNTHTFETVLEGFINVYEDSGQYNNRTFAYKLPSSVLEQCEKEREELLSWARTKAKGRVQEAYEPWNEEGLAKFTYGGETKKPEPIFVDTEGAPIERAVLRAVRRGTKVRLIVHHKPYVIPQKIGTSLRVLGVQIVELATGNGAVDSGTLTVDDVVAEFGCVDGFKQADPTVRQAAAEEISANCTPEGTSYDF